MLTRAYDAIMAALQTPMILNQNVDYNTSAIDDSVLNCKDYNGTVRPALSPSGYTGSSMNTPNYPASTCPFADWHANSYSSLLPDAEESAPDYEDYSVAKGNPSGWAAGSLYPSFSKSYDPDTKEIVCSVTMLWQNTSGAAKTVYGVKVRCQNYCRPSYSTTNTSAAYYLVCREHFASPVAVEDQGIISLTFKWRVGRAGLVSATAAAAE